MLASIECLHLQVPVVHSGSLGACLQAKLIAVTNQGKHTIHKQEHFKLVANGWAWELVPYRSARSLSTSGTARRYPWQPCKWEPPLHATATWHCHTEKSSVEKKTYLTLYLPNLMNHEGGRTGSKIPQWFTEQVIYRILVSSQRYAKRSSECKWSAEISWNMTQNVCKPWGVLQAPRSHLAGHIHK